MASNEEAVTSTLSDLEPNIDDVEIFDSWTLISDKTIDRLESVKDEIESILAEELGLVNQTESMSGTSGVEEILDHHTDDQMTDTDCEQSDGISIISDSEYCPDRMTPSPSIQTIEKHNLNTHLETTYELSSFENETPPNTPSEELEENLTTDDELPRTSTDSIFKSSNILILGVLFGIAGIAIASFFSTPIVTNRDCPDLTHISPLVRRIHDVEMENRELKRELNSLRTKTNSEKSPVIQNKRTRVWTGDDNAETITIADKRFVLPDYCHHGKDELFDEYSTKNCLRMQKKIDERLKKNSFKKNDIKKENIKKVNIPIIDTSEISGILNTNTGFVPLDSVFSDNLIKPTPNLFPDVFAIDDKKNSTDSGKKTGESSEGEELKKDSRYKGKRVRLEKYKKDDRRKSSYSKKKDDEKYPQLNIREEISYSGDGQEKPWSKTADNKRKVFKENKNFEYKEKDQKFKKDKKFVENFKENSKKFDENEKFIFKEKQKFDDNSETDWHENLMKYREEMRSKNPENAGDSQNNWYLKRGSNRQKFRSNEGSGVRSTFR